jgi:uncharacterized protein YbjT (DUF2867 family)
VIVALRRKHDEVDSGENVGAETLLVDYADADALAHTLAQVDVLVSTLGGQDGLKAQKTLAQAAKTAGVKLFIPS